MPQPDENSRGLPALLITLALVTGLVDALSFLGLGRVFVANMTGNVVLLAFALAGAPGLSADRSALALAGFLAGAIIAGRIGRPVTRTDDDPMGKTGGTARGHHAACDRRSSWLVVALSVQALLLAGALVAALLTGEIGQSRPYAVLVPLALAMGLQHATARRVALPEIPTNVLTSTLTGLVVESRLGGGTGASGRRSLAAVTAMFAGALVGGLCVLHVDPMVALAAATGLVTACLIASALGAVTPRPEPPTTKQPAAEGPAGKPSQERPSPGKAAGEAAGQTSTEPESRGSAGAGES